MKKNFIVAGLFIAGLYNAQQNGSVGINTKSPSGATLDVQISTDADKSLGQGVAVPRVSKQQLSEMTGTIAEGTLVYVNTIGTATGSATTRVADVTTANGVGFYYFNGKSTETSSKWVKVGGGASSTSSANLYTQDGTLSSARTVTQNNQNLTFATGTTGRTIVDGNFETKGAVYGKTRAHSGDLLPSTWQSDDFQIVLSGTTNAIALPNASDNPGRILSIVNQTGGTRNFIAGAENKPKNTGNLGGGKGTLYISNGAEWYILGGY